MNLPLTDNNPSPSTRQPNVAISFSGGGGAGGGLMDSVGGLADAVGVNLSGDSVDPWLRSLVALQSESHIAPNVDQLKIQIAQDSQSPEFAIADEGEIELGYADDQLHTVFTGAINFIQNELTQQTTITVSNAAHVLSQKRSNESFEQQSAGDIVASLAASSGVQTDNIEQGLSFPFYVIDDSRNHYQHIAELAEKSGYIAFINTENELNFVSLSSEPAIRTFVYGVDILAAKSIKSKQSVDQVSITGQGAASSQGSEAWDWLVKDPSAVSSTAGSGDSARIISDHSIRSADAAQQAAAGRLFLLKQSAYKVRLTVAGAADVAIGSRVEIADVPQDSFNGEGVVGLVRHRFSKHAGFISELVVYMDNEDNSLDLLGGLF